ncbi:MAG TPA: polymer-forming cytoskeletal protein [Steroidobacteraceae bacterium]|jgi:cytoskeletal protein CcmA (bactofilin family)|nr:polymer-forming cytoskeletal protein [Steroidobacteraceae bacterium]
MAIWKDIVAKDSTQPDPAAGSPPPVNRPRPEVVANSPAPSAAPIAPSVRRDLKETVIAAGLTFEGKIDGSGHVRISGRFKGDVHVDGTLTVDAGAHLAGAVRAGSVVVAGEIEGNIEGAQRVELHQTGVVNGDIAAGSLTVADGARMRGKAEFGWGDSGGKGGGNR